MTKALAVRESEESALTVSEILEQKALIQDVMKQAMKKNLHYGKIPGCGNKPVLLQPGAQLILLLFKFNPDYAVERIDLPGGHREYSIKCVLTTQRGIFIGAGVGSCSTMESRYRFRVAPKKPTGRSVPGKYWQLRKKNPAAAQDLIGGEGFSVKKVGKDYEIVEGTSERVEHDNPADYYNTCLKIAKKRALNDATLTRTAAGDIFTQDMEEVAENEEVYSEGENSFGSTQTAAAESERAKTPTNQTLKKATDAERQVFLEAFKDEEREKLYEYGLAKGYLKRGAPIEAWELKDVPMGKAAIEVFRSLVRQWNPNAKTDDGDLGPQALKWRDVRVPSVFKTNAGKQLGELSDKSLAWYIDNVTVKPGDVSEVRGFRIALDAARDELGDQFGTP